MDKESFFVLVCGGRDYKDAARVKSVLDKFREDMLDDKIMWVVHGAARGADTLAGQWALENQVPVAEFPADWDAHPKAAGPIRNKEMLEFLLLKKSVGAEICVIAFAGGTGTANMAKIAKAKHIQVYNVGV